MKKIILILLAAVLILSMVACVDEKAPSTIDATDHPEETSTFSEFQWPKSDIAKLLPIPESNIGSISWEASYGFVIYVGETSKEQYDAYVDECWENGFTIDYSKGEDFFWADNESGYHLHLKYEGNDTMFVRIDEPDETEESSTPDNSMPEATTPETATPETSGQVFSPQDVSDATIESIQTYNDYLVMYQMIIEDYFSNYEAVVKDTILYDADSFAEMKKTYEDSFEQQKDMYGSMGDMKIIGKETLVEFLINYRDSLKEFTDNLANSVN